MNNDIRKSDLMDIAVLSRAVLVLDDYLDDEFIDSASAADWVRNWIGCLEAELAMVYSRIGEAWDSYLRLKTRAREEVTRRSAACIRGRVFQSSIEKCLIFFNPYRTCIARRSSHHSERLRFLEAFFFACQLLDDFQDLPEDRNKRLNNNIFLESTPPCEHDTIIDTRLRWVPSLLMAIRCNLMRTQVQTGVLGSRVFTNYLQAAFEYLDAMIDVCPDSASAEASAPCAWFEEWSFEPLSVLAQRAMPHSAGHWIRPEFLQTFSSGYRRIEDV